MDKSKVKGLSASQIKKLQQASNFSSRSSDHKIINNRSRVIKRTIVQPTRKTPGVVTIVKRPDNKFLTTLAKNVKRMNLPERGSFNAGLVKFPNKNEYILVYRPDEFRFIACVLDEQLEIISEYCAFQVTNCADPRVIWTPDNKLLMVYSSVDEDISRECIRGSIIMDLNVSEKFLDNSKPFRISPISDQRHKNWMPFVHEEKIFLIASVCPHVIYELKLNLPNCICTKVAETKWLNPWMFKEFLRGNTNPVQLEDGNYLSTFHTATWYNGRCFYDNGAYIFEGKFPFRVLKCANRTYLKAEDAVEPHFRKGNIIVCTFPVGMVREGDKLLISYGDNDSCVKIMETTVEDMISLMLDVY
jgi:predicted GH43/DUF377 family glycosyl hydrolase